MGDGTIKLHCKKVGVDGMKAATLGYKGRRRPGSWHSSPAKKGKNHQSISPPKNKSTYIISPDGVETVMLNLLLCGKKKKGVNRVGNKKAGKHLSKSTGREAAHHQLQGPASPGVIITEAETRAHRAET